MNKYAIIGSIIFFLTTTGCAWGMDKTGGTKQPFMLQDDQNKIFNDNPYDKQNIEDRPKTDEPKIQKLLDETKQNSPKDAIQQSPNNPKTSSPGYSFGTREVTVIFGIIIVGYGAYKWYKWYWQATDKQQKKSTDPTLAALLKNKKQPGIPAK
jgi:preprotein translocase subunit SecF